jgi:hypothetical protein
VTIYNEFRRRRPDLLPMLFAPIETDRRGEVPAGARPYFRIPVFSWHAGLLSVIYQRQYIESARRFPDVAPLTPRQIEALDLFDALANDPALHLHMEFRPGDIQLVHDHTLLHDRTSFEDWPEPARRRHLLRLWLAPADARPLPPVFAERYGSVIPGERGAKGSLKKAESRFCHGDLAVQILSGSSRERDRASASRGARERLMGGGDPPHAREHLGRRG